jgi:prepilin-type N-terminal cleavage/methylation domain-containing protein/prepilin-type processing-associated H-X9-DG protein
VISKFHSKKRISIKWKKDGFTLTELLVVIAIMGGLAALLVPAVKNGMNSGKQSKGLSNLKQIGALALSYAAENGGRLPLGRTEDYSSWLGLVLAEYTGWVKADGKRLPDIFYDPTVKPSREHPYGSLGVNISIVLREQYCDALFGHTNGISLMAIPKPSTKVMVASAIDPGIKNYDSSWYVDGGGFAQTGVGGGDYFAYPDPRYGGKAGCLFADGHVEKLDVKNMDQATRRRYFTLDP